MAYEKNEWELGDIITAEKLNHMEDGIADANEGGGGGGTGYYDVVCTITVTHDNDWIFTPDMTYAELSAAQTAGKKIGVVFYIPYSDGATLYGHFNGSATYMEDSGDGDAFGFNALIFNMLSTRESGGIKEISVNAFSLFIAEDGNYPYTNFGVLETVSE